MASREVTQRQQDVDLVDEVVKGLLRGGISPRTLFVGIHNAFVHGEILKEADVEFTDKQLEKLFEHFDDLIAVAKKMH